MLYIVCLVGHVVYTVSTGYVHTCTRGPIISIDKHSCELAEQQVLLQYNDIYYKSEPSTIIIISEIDKHAVFNSRLVNNTAHVVSTCIIMWFTGQEPS